MALAAGLASAFDEPAVRVGHRLELEARQRNLMEHNTGREPPPRTVLDKFKAMLIGLTVTRGVGLHARERENREQLRQEHVGHPGRLVQRHARSDPSWLRSADKADHVVEPAHPPVSGCPPQADTRIEP
ncbi:hypothetical protein [Nocardioides sp. MH1]|uniref:hypothetical protein n=1 Tax=Nocardioides sp. MH1 TaxID=3242490 RepID=UPI003521B49D